MGAWELDGKFYGSLKELDMTKNPLKYVSVKFTPKTEIHPVSDDVATTNDFVEIENKEIE